MIRDFKNFLWGTFNYRNKGMTAKGHLITGYNFMKIRKEEEK